MIRGMRLDRAKPRLHTTFCRRLPIRLLLLICLSLCFLKREFRSQIIFHLSKSDQYRQTFRMYADLTENLNENYGHKRARH
jgi:hypothetical protein